MIGDVSGIIMTLTSLCQQFSGIGLNLSGVTDSEFSDEYVATLATNMGGSVLYGTGGASKFLYSRLDNRVIKQARNFSPSVESKNPAAARPRYNDDALNKLDELFAEAKKRSEAKKRRAKGEAEERQAKGEQKGGKPKVKQKSGKPKVMTPSSPGLSLPSTLWR
ncbi:hypothetical protein [Mycobacterium sp. 050134]|uniref:hypothetical protein n=1 Tax=Mycobacterium sp. 050134 TaxID=3096111 RepID=UPI002ED9DAEE